MNIFTKTGPQRGRTSKPGGMADVILDEHHPGYFKIFLPANMDPGLEMQLGLLVGIMAVAETHPVRHYELLERLKNPFGEAIDSRYYLPNTFLIAPRFFDKSMLREFLNEFDAGTIRRMVAAIPEEFPDFRLFSDEVSIELSSEAMTAGGNIGRNFVEVRARWQTPKRPADANGSSIPGLIFPGAGSGMADGQSQQGTVVAQLPKGTVVARPAGLGSVPLLFVDWKNDGTLTPLFEGDVVGRYGAGDPEVRDVMPWATASGKHFRVERDATAAAFVRDVGSRNSTIIQPADGSRLVTLTRGQTCHIGPADRIGVSDTDGTLRLAMVTLSGNEVLS